MVVPGGFLHLFFEGISPIPPLPSPNPFLTPRPGYFVLNHAAIPASQSLFAQLWKEYSLSDSRYLTSDPFMLCIETLTVVCLVLPIPSSHHHPVHPIPSQTHNHPSLSPTTSTNPPPPHHS